MSDKILFVYDGECPFCNHFAQLLELKCSLSNFEISDGRENLALLTKLYNQGYDLNKGAILINNENIMLEGELFSLDGKERFYHKDSKEIKFAFELGKEVGLILKKESKNSYKK